MKKINSKMQIAYNEALIARDHGEIPVGAVLVKNGEILAKSHNVCRKKGTFIAHAELNVIELGCQILGTPYLSKCDIYVTLEPCALCAAALSLSRIRRIYFGAYNSKGGGIDHGAQVLKHAMWKPEIIGGIMEIECGELLSHFFKKNWFC